MTKKSYIIIISIICITMLIIITGSYQINKKIELLTNLTTNLLNDFHDEKPIEEPKIHIKERTIEIDFTFADDFSTLTPVEQFTYFEFFTKRLRFFLLTNQEGSDALQTLDISISAKTSDEKYLYESSLPNENLIYNAQSTLSTNNNIIYSSAEFKKQYQDLLSKIPNDQINGYDELDIYHYGENFYRILTKNGKNFNPKTDPNLIINAIMDKFHITEEQYRKIYSKYFLFFAR